MTPDWITAMSPDERNAVNNGAFIGERYRTHEMIAKYRAVVEHMEKQPRSVAADQARAVLGVQIDLLLEQAEQIQQRSDEWHAYHRQCMDGTENWQTGLPWRRKP